MSKLYGTIQFSYKPH